MDGNFPFVSIIIPTYKDWNRLSICLLALTKQSYSSDSFEIIVVNNCPEDQPNIGFELPTNCIVIDEAKPGSYSARNAALKVARGLIIGFTDSDCTPNKDWIKNAVASFSENPKYDRLAGRIELYFRSDILTLGELYESVYAFQQEHLVLTKGSSVTANMFSKKLVFDKVGVFNDTLLSGGDHEWARRAQRLGFCIGYAENVVVMHPARALIGQLIKKAKRVSGGRTKMLKRTKTDALVSLIKALKPPVRCFKEISKFRAEYSTLTQLKIFGVKYYLNIVGGLESVNIAYGKAADRE